MTKHVDSIPEVGTGYLTKRRNSPSRLRDTGVIWFSELPAHWTVRPLKALLSQNNGGCWGDEPDGISDTIVLRSTEQTEGGGWRIESPAIRKLSLRDRLQCQLRVGELVITKSSGSELHIGKTCLVTSEIELQNCCFSNFMQRLRCTEGLLPRFLFFFLNSPVGREQFVHASNSTTGLANLTGTMIGNVRLPLPPLDEQRKIAEFLDRETAKIDELIRKKKRLLELLEIKRRIIVERAVTRGLSPSIPLKEVDVAWLSSVPVHWTVCRIANIYRPVAEDGREELPILSVSIHSGISDQQIPDDEMDRKVLRSEDKSKYLRVRPGDLVYNMMRAWQGAFGAATVEGMVSPAYVVARPSSPSPISTQFVENLLRTPNAIEEMRRNSYGVADFRLRLYWDRFKNIKVGLPPLHEANEICEYIKGVEAAVKRVVVVTSRAIESLKQYRSALISAAVTGQIDVRARSAQVN